MLVTDKAVGDRIWEGCLAFPLGRCDHLQSPDYELARSASSRNEQSLTLFGSLSRLAVHEVVSQAVAIEQYCLEGQRRLRWWTRSQ